MVWESLVTIHPITKLGTQQALTAPPTVHEEAIVLPGSQVQNIQVGY